MKNMLIYYGWLNSFNSASNGWNNDNVAADLAQYDVLVFGDGIQDPSHGDYSNTQAIIPKIKNLNPDIEIYGYVTVNQTVASAQTKAEQWNNLAVNGIFLDEAGYDFGSASTNGREPFNELVDFIHGLSSANRVFANAWQPEHVLGETNDASYPNTSYNPHWIESDLDENDTLLLENFGIVNGAYEDKDQWLLRGNRARALSRATGVRLAAVSVIADTDANAQTKFDFAEVSAAIFGLEVFGSAHTNYGASDAKTAYWTRQDFGVLEDEVVDLRPFVHMVGSEASRTFERGKLTVDFTSASEASLIEEF
jgi:hypothetical protein